jgi:DNA-binding response OmpR family regulator
MPTIAIVDDDPEWAQLCTRILRSSSLETIHYPTAGRFFDSLTTSKPALVILDMQMPGMHGREVIRVLRNNADTAGILIVGISAHDIGSPFAIEALKAGADEYLAKPVDSDFLSARIQTLLRRSVNGRSNELKITLGELEIFPDQRSATVGGSQVTLSHLEFEVLLALARQPDRVLTRSLVLETAWKTDSKLGTRRVDKVIQSIRLKLGPCGENIETVVRVGYVYKRKP